MITGRGTVSNPNYLRILTARARGIANRATTTEVAARETQPYSPPEPPLLMSPGLGSLAVTFPSNEKAEPQPSVAYGTPDQLPHVFWQLPQRHRDPQPEAQRESDGAR